MNTYYAVYAEIVKGVPKMERLGVLLAVYLLK